MHFWLVTPPERTDIAAMTKYGTRPGLTKKACTTAVQATMRSTNGCPANCDLQQIAALDRWQVGLWATSTNSITLSDREVREERSLSRRYGAWGRLILAGSRPHRTG